jgi:hypothetical protein
MTRLNDDGSGVVIGDCADAAAKSRSADDEGRRARVWSADVGEDQNGDRERRCGSQKPASHSSASYTAPRPASGRPEHVEGRVLFSNGCG